MEDFDELDAVEGLLDEETSSKRQRRTPKHLILDEISESESPNLRRPRASYDDRIGDGALLWHLRGDE